MTSTPHPYHQLLKIGLANHAASAAKLAPLIAHHEAQKQALLDILANVIVQFVEEYGTIYRSHDKKFWYRMMPCSRPPHDIGFQGRINAVFGQIDWNELYRPALEKLDRTKAIFSFGMGECDVVLNEKLTASQVRAIRKARRLKPSP